MDLLEPEILVEIQQNSSVKFLMISCLTNFTLRIFGPYKPFLKLFSLLPQSKTIIYILKTDF